MRNLCILLFTRFNTRYGNYFWWGTCNYHWDSAPTRLRRGYSVSLPGGAEAAIGWARGGGEGRGLRCCLATEASGATASAAAARATAACPRSLDTSQPWNSWCGCLRAPARSRPSRRSPSQTSWWPDRAGRVRKNRPSIWRGRPQIGLLYSVSFFILLSNTSLVNLTCLSWLHSYYWHYFPFRYFMILVGLLHSSFFWIEISKMRRVKLILHIFIKHDSLILFSHLFDLLSTY